MTARSYARVYETTTDKTNGNAVSTWPRSGLTNGGGGQATVVYSDVQRVVYSTNYVYVYVTGLPSYTAGNWLTPNNMVYTSWPTNRGAIQKIPRNVTIPATKQKNNGSGGVLLNGVYVWQNGDAQSYANASSTSGTATISMSGDGIWNRLAGVAETFNFDPAYGHQPNSGAYHNHINPIALRYQLGDNVTSNAATKVYAEAATITKHSPLVGWANDGLPIYGPYGYSSAMDSTSGIRRMTSGFVKRNSTNAALYATDDLAVTGRVKLPVWAASVQGKSQALTSGQYGPSTTATYALGPVNKTCAIGTFAEDYEYLGDLGKTQGFDFDLNRQNVRYCVTPEFPSGTYAYFVCIDDSGNSVFPDIINQEYFGTAAMGSGTVTSITESVTEYKRGGQASPISLTAAASGTGVKLTWTSVEGGTYTVASSPDGTTYTTLSSSVASAGGATTTYDTATLAPYYKVTLNAVATSDTNGNGGVSGVGTAATVNYPAGSMPPSITSQPSGQTLTTGAKATFTVAATGTPTLAYQWRKNGNALSGATSASYVITTTASTDAGTYSVVVTNGAGNATSSDAVLVLNDPVIAPVITTPPATQTVTYGDPVTFTVAATSTEAVTYQWKKNGTAIIGQTASSYTIASAVSADVATYTVVVTNSGGTTTSAAATLTVNVPVPVITTPPATQTVTYGNPVTFTAVASSPVSVTYQWKKNGTAITSQTGSSYTIAATTFADVATYTVVVTNSGGSTTSAGATLAVSGIAPVITAQPSGLILATGAKATFTVAATGSPTLTYQWRKNGNAISGATSATYVINTSALADSGLYSVVVTNTAGTATSNDAALTVNDPPTITAQPATQTITYGNPVTFTAVATSAEAVSYQWKKAGVAIAGQTADTYTIPSVALTDMASYTVTVTNALTGGTTTSAAATLTVAVPTPALSVAGEIPTGGAVTLDMTGGNPVTGVTYFATGLPAGLSLNATTGQITGAITAGVGTYTVTYWAQVGTTKSTVKTVQIVVSTFPSTMIGGFEGLLEDGSGLPAGKVALTVTTTGAFTGSLTTADAKAYSLKGKLALNGDYSAGTAALTVSRGAGLAAYALGVSISSGSVLTATITGVGTTTEGVKLVAYAKGQTSPWAASYTFTLGEPVNLGGTTAPEGDGYATAKISTAGALSVTGKLADGTALTGTLSAGADGSYRCYLKPYKTAGNYLAGWLPLTARNDEAGRYQIASSDFYWKKPAASSDKLYPAGFGPMALTVNMQKWVAPASGVTLGSRLGVGAGGGTLALAIDGAGLSNAGANTYTLPTLLNLSSAGAFSAANVTNPTALSLTVKTADGSFTGSFTLKDGSVTRKTTVQGVLLQLPTPASSAVIGRGYFLLAPTVKTNPTLSGTLEIAVP